MGRQSRPLAQRQPQTFEVERKMNAGEEQDARAVVAREEVTCRNRWTPSTVTASEVESAEHSDTKMLLLS